MKMPKKVKRNLSFVVFGLLVLSYITLVYIFVVEVRNSRTSIELTEIVDDCDWIEANYTPLTTSTAKED